jgi:hypothetical protein
MNKIAVVGGVYREVCEWPYWDEIYGSAGRAVFAIRDMVGTVELHCCLDGATRDQFAPIAAGLGVALVAHPREDDILFQYRHVLSRPRLYPPRQRIRPAPVFPVESDVVLAFGMLEAIPAVKARVCVYDPQNPIAPKAFRASGGKADRLAIVGNRSEIRRLANVEDDTAAAEAVLRDERAEVVVIKCGLEGAKIVTATGLTKIPAYMSGGGWTLGSGDVFAACFAVGWALNGNSPEAAANQASWAVSRYTEARSLPSVLPSAAELASATPVGAPPSVYLAGPFFSMDQRWLVDEAREYLTEMGAKVFSPFHEIGEGPADEVAIADLTALDASDVILALIDGCDPGTIFEVGYAVAKAKKTYAYATRVPANDLKMLVGSGVKIYDDFATSLYQAASSA